MVVALLGTLALVFLRFRRDAARGSEPATIVAAAAAVLLALLVTNKVFSPQYVIWLVPFAALLAVLPTGRPSWPPSSVSVIFPLNYEQLIAQEPWPIVMVNIRNGLMVALLGWVVARWFLPFVDGLRLRTGGTGEADPAAEQIGQPRGEGGQAGAAAGLEQDDLGLVGQGADRDLRLWLADRLGGHLVEEFLRPSRSFDRRRPRSASG